MGDGDGTGQARCRALFERLSEYLDGELEPALCDEIERHFGDCPPCEAFLASLTRTVELVEGVEAPPLPDEIRRHVAEAYRRLREKR